MYLVRIKKPKTAHYWNGKDTFCRMYSTGGIKKAKYHLVETTLGLDICTMCNNKKPKDFNDSGASSA